MKIRHVWVSAAIWMATGASALCAADTILPPGVRAVWDIQKAYRETTATRERVCLNGLWRWQPAKQGAECAAGAGVGIFQGAGVLAGAGRLRKARIVRRFLAIRLGGKCRRRSWMRRGISGSLQFPPIGLRGGSRSTRSI